MSTPNTQARSRYFAIAATRIAGSLGAVFGLFLVAKGVVWWEKGLGIAIVLSAMYMIATVPRALAHKWRTPDA
jgi:hypothetical protein